MGRLDDKNAVITGAASGLGAATARMFAAEGANVVIADLNLELAKTVADSIGDQAVAVHCDVTNEDDIAGAIELAVDRWGHLDVMYNNAGIIGAVGSIRETDSAAWRHTLDVHLNSVFYGMKHAARRMVPQRSGSIISTSSITGLIGGMGPHAYATAKAGIVSLTRTVSAEVAPAGVRVNAIAPGVIPTAMTAVALTGSAPDDLSQVAEHARRAAGTGFAPDADDVAYAALYLASDESRFINGHTLVVDGGRVVNGGSTFFADAEADVVGPSGG